MIERALALLAAAALLGGCSSGGADASAGKASGDLLLGAPRQGTTACSALQTSAVESVYDAKVVQARPSASSRRTQTLQTGCVFSLADEPATTLAVHLWFGDHFKEQWADEVNAVGTDGFSEQPYGAEAYGRVSGTATEIDVAERHFAVRLVCGPRPSTPSRPLGFADCLRLADAMNQAFRA